MPLDACTPSSDGTGCRVVGVVYTGTRLYSKRIRPFFKFLDLCNKWEFGNCSCFRYCVINGNSISTKVSSGLSLALCNVKRVFCAVLLWALPFCSGLFRFALGSSVLLWALPFCSGLFRFALGSSVLLWALPFALGSSVCSLSINLSCSLCCSSDVL